MKPGLEIVKAVEKTRWSEMKFESQLRAKEKENQMQKRAKADDAKQTCLIVRSSLSRPERLYQVLGATQFAPLLLFSTVNQSSHSNHQSKFMHFFFPSPPFPSYLSLSTLNQLLASIRRKKKNEQTNKQT